MTQPDRRSGRGRRLTPPPVATCALAHKIPVLQPEKVGAPESIAALERFEADLGVVVAFGQFLTRRVRELPRCGYLINAHASLLPRHRGAAPIAYAILSGDRESGVSIMRVEKEMDAGPVASVHKTTIRADDDAGTLGDRLAVLAAEGVAEAVDRIAEGTLRWVAQDERQATTAPKLSSEEGELHFEESARAIELRVRGFAPRPGAFTSWNGARLRILGATVEEGTSSGGAAPGRIRVDARGACVAASDRWLRLLRVQRAGGVAQDITAFQRGRGLQDGDQLGGSAPGGRNP